MVLELIGEAGEALGEVVALDGRAEGALELRELGVLNAKGEVTPIAEKANGDESSSSMQGNAMSKYTSGQGITQLSLFFCLGLT